VVVRELLVSWAFDFYSTLFIPPRRVVFPSLPSQPILDADGTHPIQNPPTAIFPVPLFLPLASFFFPIRLFPDTSRYRILLTGPSPRSLSL